MKYSKDIIVGLDGFLDGGIAFVYAS